MGLFNKKELEQIEQLNNELNNLKSLQDELGVTNVIQSKTKIDEMQKEYELKFKNDENEHNNKLININNQIAKSENDLSKVKEQLNQITLEIESKKKDLYDVEETLLNESFGIYKPRHNCMNSDEYAEKIKKNRSQQKAMIKSKSALSYFNDWVLDGSKAKGKAMNNDNMKMVLRAFNNECDVLISKVKYNNIDRITKQIWKSAEAIDKLNVRNKISILSSYIRLKIEELQLVYEYECKKQEEKEAIRAARAEEREQAKLAKEIEEARKKIIKEQTHYENAKMSYIKQLENASDEDKIELNNKINEIDDKLKEIKKNVEDIDYREANQRAGYVYVISNIGAFGENIYKIGMTRRLDPQDRVDELGDASVPFTFDVHAMIFSDDAPKLEAALHNAFDKKKVNMVNGRKEFFKVTLEEIEKVIKENHDKLVEIKKIPDAEQYRESLILKKLNK